MAENTEITGIKDTVEAVKPQTEAELAAMRCQLSCQSGRNALEGRTGLPDGGTRLEYAVFTLLHAVEELSRYVQLTNRQ